MMKIQHNSQVSLFYQLLLEDGTKVESNIGDQPLELVIGDGTLTDGMEDALLDHAIGDHIEVMLSPEQAYGYPSEENRHNMPLSDFPDELKPESGQVIAFDGPDDEDIIGTIVEVQDNEVLVDFSHPLAGRTLIFKADVVDVKNSE